LLKLLHSRNVIAWIVFMMIFLATKASFFFQIPGATSYSDFVALQYVRPIVLSDTWAFCIIMIIQFVICLWIGFLINKLEIVEHHSLIPSTVSALLLSVFTTFFRWNGFYLVMILALLLLNILLRIKKERPSHYACFFAGLCQGCMTVLMPTAIIGLPFLHWALYTSKKQGLRGYLLIYIGFLIPFYFYYALLYIVGFSIIPFHSWLDSFGHFGGYIEFLDRFAIVPIILTTILCGAFINIVLGKLIFGKRQMVRVLLFYGIGLLLMVPFFVTTQTSVFLLWVFPITLIISIILLRLKKSLLVESAFGIFVIGIIILSILKI